MNAQPGQVPDKLAPDMASFRLLVFAFVRDYISLMGASPSYGEIANKLKSNRTRVKRAVLSLVQDGLLLRTPGPRGLRLPTMRDEAIRQLRDLGWVVDEEVLRLGPPGVTNPTLLPPPELDYPSRRRTGDIDGEQGGQGAGESTRDAA